MGWNHNPRSAKFAIAIALLLKPGLGTRPKNILIVTFEADLCAIKGRVNFDSFIFEITVGTVAGAPSMVVTVKINSVRHGFHSVEESVLNIWMRER